MPIISALGELMLFSDICRHMYTSHTHTQNLIFKSCMLESLNAIRVPRGCFLCCKWPKHEPMESKKLDQARARRPALFAASHHLSLGEIYSSLGEDPEVWDVYRSRPNLPSSSKLAGDCGGRVSVECECLLCTHSLVLLETASRQG